MVGNQGARSCEKQPGGLLPTTNLVLRAGGQGLCGAAPTGLKNCAVFNETQPKSLSLALFSAFNAGRRGASAGAHLDLIMAFAGWHFCVVKCQGAPGGGGGHRARGGAPALGLSGSRGGHGAPHSAGHLGTWRAYRGTWAQGTHGAMELARCIAGRH